MKKHKSIPLSIAAVLGMVALFQNCKSPQSGNLQKDKTYMELSSKRLHLPNGWSLTPAGNSFALGDLPLNMVVSPTKNLLAVTNNGVSNQSVQVFDMKSMTLLSNEPIEKSWYGLAFSEDEKQIFASGGNDNTVVIYKNTNGLIKRDTVIKLGEPWGKEKICPAGITVEGNRLFTVSKEDLMLYVCNMMTRQIEKKIPLSSEPYAVMVNKNLNELYVTMWGLKKVAVYDLQTVNKKGEINVGDHPNEMILSRNGEVLFVANSMDNSVSIVNLRTQKEIEVLNAALYPNAPNGSTTNGLALSDDEKTLFVSNADNNCLAVFDVSDLGKSRSKGFIPTGWYPTSVRVVGNKIYVANAKGMSSKANPDGPQPYKKASDNKAGQYIGSLFLGTLSVIDIPDDKTMAVYSKLTYENTPYSKEKELITEGEAGNPIPMRVGDASPIKYVFYIIKENRTYDQILGDMKEGNGNASICLFPEKVTPNQHALAREFVLMDNFYVDAEVSADGHNWSTAAYANDFIEKTWPTSYGGRGGNYDFEGSRKIAYPKGGFIWDHCKQKNISYRTYGEFADEKKANYTTLNGHFCKGYPGFDMTIQDVKREKIWEQDFDSLLALNQVPRFNSIRFGNDHTSGMRKGSYTPEAAIADNDLAVGLFIEHLSNSPIWKESAVFILEDDAQNGSDHVDAHRSPAYVISPYTRRHFHDKTMYSTSGMLRTIELILGMPPMSQYDAAATPMWRCFTSKPDLTPYKAIDAKVSIDTRNAAVNKWSKLSDSFNLAQLDAVPDGIFNEVIWKAVRGIDSEMPAPRRGAWVRIAKTEGDEDDDEDD